MFLSFLLAEESKEDFFFFGGGGWFIMNRHLNWANRTPAAVIMRSLQPCSTLAACLLTLFGPGAQRVQPSFLKSAQPGRIPGLSHLGPLCCQGRQGLVQLLRSALCLEYQYRGGGRKRRPSTLVLFFCKTYQEPRRRNAN
uniref:Uncharacterized protein n=1 Tax=Pipistrellus kuhlii TaxID=59472 RepID=A0A7J8A831_PIPKU|nr:hypothetical protein mPipKuh1_008825 [Pipistrellus kuhlii]